MSFLENESYLTRDMKKELIGEIREILANLAKEIIINTQRQTPKWIKGDIEAARFINVKSITPSHLRHQRNKGYFVEGVDYKREVGQRAKETAKGNGKLPQGRIIMWNRDSLLEYKELRNG